MGLNTLPLYYYGFMTEWPPTYPQVDRQLIFNFPLHFYFPGGYQQKPWIELCITPGYPLSALSFRGSVKDG
ncbi:hypothetical protein GCM10027180_02580 [Microbulbifer echini]